MKEICLGSGLWKKALFLAVFGLLGLGMSTDCRAAEELSTGPERTAALEGPYANYPATFDGRGVLDALGDKSVTISDSSMPLAYSVSYNLPGWVGVSQRQFKTKTGQFVAYKLNEKKEVVSLWILENMTDIESH
jgi:hypothetical protein